MTKARESLIQTSEKHPSWTRAGRASFTLAGQWTGEGQQMTLGEAIGGFKERQ